MTRRALLDRLHAAMMRPVLVIDAPQTARRTILVTAVDALAMRTADSELLSPGATIWMFEHSGVDNTLALRRFARDTEFVCDGLCLGDVELRAMLRAAIERRELVGLRYASHPNAEKIFRERTIVPRLPERRPALTPSQLRTRAEPQEKTWIEIRVLDESGSPFSARVRIRLPDGSAKEARTDENGVLRFDGIAEGMCEVTFPEMDASSWTYVGAD